MVRIINHSAPRYHRRQQNAVNITVKSPSHKHTCCFHVHFRKRHRVSLTDTMIARFNIIIRHLFCGLFSGSAAEIVLPNICHFIVKTAAFRYCCWHNSKCLHGFLVFHVPHFAGKSNHSHRIHLIT